MNMFDKLLAQIRAAEIEAKVRPRRTHHERHEDGEPRGRGQRASSPHHKKRANARQPKHRKGHRR
jgi:hypothetical protein